VTEFHVAKPDGWPKGSYKVEVFLNGNSVETAKGTLIGAMAVFRRAPRCSGGESIPERFTRFWNLV
jgi:hypothetical protein